MLREGVSFCLIGDRAVFLDLVADRYFCLPPEANARFVGHVVAGADPGCEADIAPRTVSCPDAGGNDGGIRPVHVPKIERSLFVDNPATSRWRTLVALASQIAAAARLAHRPFHHVVTGLPAPVGIDRWDEMRARQVIGAFLASGRLITLNNRCLRVSLAMTGSLRRAGLPASLVFGIKLDPFAAHCWVQAGTALLSDTVEHAGLFTPIAIV